ncbi:MAG: 2-C-methyl-D-erythritol 4-phosphate cytidylyltransferase [Acidimicrobiales bacterium]
MTVVWTIVVAGGSGSRFGRPKQFDDLEGRRVVDWAIAAARSVSAGVVLVVPADARPVNDMDATGEAVDVVVAGGATRSGSVRAGLAAVPAEAEVVLVHDAARPLADTALFQRVIDAVVGGADGAVPAVPVTDTITAATDGLDGGSVGASLDRRGLAAVQTPQGFSAAALRLAHRGDPEATDDASLVAATGGKVVFVPGDPTNLKITHPTDLVVAAALIASRS